MMEDMRTANLSTALLISFMPLLSAEEVLEVRYSDKAPELSANPNSKFWREAKPVYAAKNNLGKELPANKTEIRARFSRQYLHVLFICPYETLYLKPNPEIHNETNKLWEHDVAEIFIGADFEHIHRYREYQVSPQGEWVDLDIDTKHPLPEGGWRWDSSMKVKARIDAKAKVWYGEFRIPLESITAKAVSPGTVMRGNFYRFQGPPPDRMMVAWKPTGRPSNHTPEEFGRIEFVR
jgi:hypothetical protein